MGISHRYPYIVLMPQFVLSPIEDNAIHMHLFHLKYAHGGKVSN